MSKLYIERMQSAIPFMPPHLYDSPEGRLRLAREIGGSLADSESESAKYQMSISYDILLKATALKPIVDKKTWDTEVLQGYNKELDRRIQYRKSIDNI